jgi:hypothetical protein
LSVDGFCKYDAARVCDRKSCFVFDSVSGSVSSCKFRVGRRGPVVESPVMVRKTSDSGRKFLKVLGFGNEESKWISQYDSWPIREGASGGYTMVGRGPVYSSACGKHLKYYFCDNVDLHTGEFEGKDVWRNVVSSCTSAGCSRCWKYGWCVRGANSINSRFLTAESVKGLSHLDVEHICASVPKSLYDLSYDELCVLVVSALKSSNVFGGCTIWHAFRKDYDRRDLFYSAHFHVLGYIRGGYDRCRECVDKKCMGSLRLRHYLRCDGFEAVTRGAHVDDGWIVGLAKNEEGVVEKRESLFSTAWYQLEHSSLRVGVKGFHVVKWFGVVGNRKFETVLRPFEHRCVVCDSDMRVSFPTGVESIVSNRGEVGFVRNFMTEHVDDRGDC